MVNNKDIQKLFTALYGVGVELQIPKQIAPPAIDHVKNYFVKSITEWRNAYLVQDTLHTKFGIDLNGYDRQLYSALESMMHSFFGPIKGMIIVYYVYCPINLEVEPFKITNKNGKNYSITDAEQLYYFIINTKDQDFIIEEEQ